MFRQHAQIMTMMIVVVITMKNMMMMMMMMTCPFQDHRFRAQTSKHHRGSADTEPNPEDDHYHDLDDLDGCVGGG